MVNNDEKWMYAYHLAKDYYNKNGNLEINTRYICSNGFTLGAWLCVQRKKYNNNKLNNQKIKLLNEIKMEWNVRKTEDVWYEYYELATNYYNNFHNLYVEVNFITSDGVNYDEDGYQLGRWLHEQRAKYNGTRNERISNEKIELLNNIGMIWNLFDYNWDLFFKLATNYYNNYNNLKIKSDFISSDGINYDEDGYQLGRWLALQRTKYCNKTLSDDRMKKLDSIGMIWQLNEYKWSQCYQLAKNYYEYYGNLYVNNNFKTNDGINYDSNGYQLGRWLNTQRERLDPKDVNNKEVDLLNSIGMIWDYHKSRRLIVSIKKQDRNSMKKVLNTFLIMLEKEKNEEFKSLNDVKKIENKFSKRLNRW